MIISHQHRLIFIKNVKTAGTSIEVYLSEHCGPGDIVTPVLPPEPGHRPRNHDGFYNHMPAHEIRASLPRAAWDDYFRFTVERNPWDKTLSHFHMARERLGRDMSFDAYLDAGLAPVTRALYIDPRSGEMLVHRVLRFERLDQELGDVFAQQGVPWSGRLDVHAKASTRTDRRPYREVYTPAQRARVAALFAWEIEQFGYEY